MKVVAVSGDTVAVEAEDILVTVEAGDMLVTVEAGDILVTVEVEDAITVERKGILRETVLKLITSERMSVISVNDHTTACGVFQ